MFRFKNISSDDMKVIIEEEEHFLAKAPKRYEAIEIEGKDGFDYNDFGYANIERPIKVQMLDKTRLDDILAWLDGKGTLEYKDRVTTAYFFETINPIRTATIKIADFNFIRKPFWLKKDNDFKEIKLDFFNILSLNNLIWHSQTAGIKSYSILDDNSIQIIMSATSTESRYIRFRIPDNMLENSMYYQFSGKANKDNRQNASTNIYGLTVIRMMNKGTSTVIASNILGFTDLNTKSSNLFVNTDIYDYYIDFYTNYSDTTTVLDGAIYQYEELQLCKIGYGLTKFTSKNKCPGTIKHWESGSYDGTGIKMEWPSRIRIKDLIKIEGTSLYFNTYANSDSFKFMVNTYDVSKKFIRYIGVINNDSTLNFTSNEIYMSLTLVKQNDTTITFSDYTTLFNDGSIKPFATLSSETDKSFIPYYGSFDNYDIEIGKGIDSNGNIVDNPLCFITKKIYYDENTFKNIINMPNTAAGLSGASGWARVYYDENDKVIMHATINNSSTQPITTPQNTKYMRIGIRSDSPFSNSTTLNTFIQRITNPIIIHKYSEVERRFIKNDFEQGYWGTTTGNDLASNNYIRTKNFIDVKANQLYGRFFKINVIDNKSYLSQYINFAEDKSWISGGGNVLTVSTGTPPANTKYLKTNLHRQDLTPITLNELEYFSIKELNTLFSFKERNIEILNEGNVYSEPILLLEKTTSNHVDLTINDVRFLYKFNDDDYVEIDCENRTAKMDGLLRNSQLEIGFEFPRLNPGINILKINLGDLNIKIKNKDRFL